MHDTKYKFWDSSYSLHLQGIAGILQSPELSEEWTLSPVNGLGR